MVRLSDRCVLALGAIGARGYYQRGKDSGTKKGRQQRKIVSSNLIPSRFASDTPGSVLPARRPSRARNSRSAQARMSARVAMKRLSRLGPPRENAPVASPRPSPLPIPRAAEASLASYRWEAARLHSPLLKKTPWPAAQTSPRNHPLG